MPTIIPAFSKENALFLYRGPESKMFDISGFAADPSKRDRVQAEIQRAKLEGWTEERYAVCLYHPQLGAKVVYSLKEKAILSKQGWTETPIKEFQREEVVDRNVKGEILGTHAVITGATGVILHQDAVSPHAMDVHRQIYLAQTESAD